MEEAQPHQRVVPSLAAEVIVGPNRATKALGALTACRVEWEMMFNIKYLKAEFFLNIISI